MVQRSVTHATFVIERKYDAAPAKVFAAFADPAKKRRWFGGPEEWERGEYSLDFRVGGRELASGGPAEGPKHRYDALYYDIVPNERIVIAYDMHLDGKRISVSLATVEMRPAGNGTKLTFTEQGAFLDGYDDSGSRERGTQDLLHALGKYLQRQSADA